MAKFDLDSIVEDVRKTFKGKENISKRIGKGSDLRELEEKDYIRLPSFWQDSTKTFGLPFGKVVLIAGPSDSGKTSLAIEAMKAAQAQGCGVLYIETENKTAAKDLTSWGVDADQVMMIHSAIAEEAFELCCQTWDSFKKQYKDTPLLVIIDSLGNMLSKRDSDLDLTEQSQSPGGKGRINRLGLNKLIAKMQEDNTALLLISYTYDNMGSVGKTVAGGGSLGFFSSLTYQTSRKSWLERVVKGEKQRYGARVIYKLQKNHLQKENVGAKEILFDITKEGMALVNQKTEDA